MSYKFWDTLWSIALIIFMIIMSIIVWHMLTTKKVCKVCNMTRCEYIDYKLKTNGATTFATNLLLEKQNLILEGKCIYK